MLQVAAWNMNTRRSLCMEFYDGTTEMVKGESPININNFRATGAKHAAAVTRLAPFGEWLPVALKAKVHCCWPVCSHITSFH